MAGRFFKNDLPDARGQRFFIVEIRQQIERFVNREAGLRAAVGEQPDASAPVADAVADRADQAHSALIAVGSLWTLLLRKHL